MVRQLMMKPKKIPSRKIAFGDKKNKSQLYFVTLLRAIGVLLLFLLGHKKIRYSVCHTQPNYNIVAMVKTNVFQMLNNNNSSSLENQFEHTVIHNGELPTF